MSIKLSKLVSGFYPPVFVEHLADAVQDALRTGLVVEEVMHGGGDAPPEGPAPGKWWCGWISTVLEENHKNAVS
jgi:hypothetical protein